MKIRIHNRARGFSLVELLLTMMLILCLAAASVFTFTAIFRSANLDEGFDRFQSIIRFAQAEAATTGRKVRMEFVPVESVTDGRAELRAIRVTWESDFLNAPGVFQAHTNKAWSEEIVNELVGIEKVLAVGSARRSAMMESNFDTAEDLFDSEVYPSITFYPDGSCDSAELVLASRNSDDERRLAVRVSGMLGSVSSRPLSPAEEEIDLDAVAQEFEDEFNYLFEEAVPVASTAFAR